MDRESIKGYCQKCNRVRMHTVFKLDKMHVVSREQTTASVLNQGYVCKKYVEEAFSCDTCGNFSKYVLKITD